MDLIDYFVKNGMGPKVQSGNTRWDQKSTYVKNGMVQLSMGLIVLQLFMTYFLPSSSTPWRQAWKRCRRTLLAMV